MSSLTTSCHILFQPRRHSPSAYGVPAKRLALGAVSVLAPIGARLDLLDTDEGAVESTGMGKTQPLRDIAYPHVRLGEQLAGTLDAYVLKLVAETGAHLGKMTL